MNQLPERPSVCLVELLRDPQVLARINERACKVRVRARRALERRSRRADTSFRCCAHDRPHHPRRVERVELARDAARVAADVEPFARARPSVETVVHATPGSSTTSGACDRGSSGIEPLLEDRGDDLGIDARPLRDEFAH